jgi:hypothetical protein
MIPEEERPGKLRKRDPELKPSTFDVFERRRHVNVFRVDKLWVFKYFFEDKEAFKAFLGWYNRDLYRFEFKSVGARNQALKLLERSGLDYDLIEDLEGYVVKLPKSAKYAQVLKNSVVVKETADERIFLREWFIPFSTQLKLYCF